jgi:hypothetical protein
MVGEPDYPDGRALYRFRPGVQLQVPIFIHGEDVRASEDLKNPLLELE